MNRSATTLRFGSVTVLALGLACRAWGAPSDCLPPATGLRDVNGDGIGSLGIVGASNTVGRLNYSEGSPHGRPIPAIWDFPSVAEGIRAALEPEGIIVQWDVPESMEWGVTVNHVAARTTFTQIDWVLTHVDPPVDAIIVGSGLDGSAGEVNLRVHTMEEVKARINELIIDSLPGQRTTTGYDLYILTQTRTIDCDCGGTNTCRCCTDPEWSCQSYYGGWDAVASLIDEVNAYLRTQTVTVIDAGVVDTAGSVDYIHHGPAGVAQKVMAVAARLVDPTREVQTVPKRCTPQTLHCLDGTLVCTEADGNACTKPVCDLDRGCTEETVADGGACTRTTGCVVGECHAGACVESALCEAIEVAPTQVVPRRRKQQEVRVTCVAGKNEVCEARGFLAAPPNATTSTSEPETARRTDAERIACPMAVVGTPITKRVRQRVEETSDQVRLELKLNRVGKCLLEHYGPAGIDVRVRASVGRRDEEPQALDFLVRVVRKS